MSTIAEIADEMATIVRGTLETVLGTDLPIQVEPRMLPNPTALTIDIYPADPVGLQDGAGFGGRVGQWAFTVRARTNTPDHESSQDLLLALMDDEDPLSLIGALTDDDTLNGTVTSVNVQGPSGYIQYVDPAGQGAWLGFEVRATVLKAQS